MSDKQPLVEPTNREIIEHMHELHRSALQCQLEGFKVVLGRLHAIEQRLSAIEAHAQGQSHV